MKYRLLDRTILALSVIVLILSWYIFTTEATIHYLKPTPLDVLEDVREHAFDYVKQTSITCLEAALGFALGNISAFVVSLLIARSKLAARVVYPYAIALKATPVVAWAPIMVVLFGLGPSTKVGTAAFVCFFPLIVQLPDALHRVPKDLVDALKVMGASRWQILKTLELRLALPDIFAALKTSTSLSLVGAIMGEFISPGAGLGKLMVEAIGRGNGAELVSAALATTLAGVSFFYLVWFTQRLVIRWDPEMI